MSIEIEGITLYTIKELSETLQVTPETLRNYITSKKLKGRKVGGRFLVSSEALREFFMTFPDEEEKRGEESFYDSAKETN